MKHLTILIPTLLLSLAVAGHPIVGVVPIPVVRHTIAAHLVTIAVVHPMIQEAATIQVVQVIKETATCAYIGAHPLYWLSSNGLWRYRPTGFH